MLGRSPPLAVGPSTQGDPGGNKGAVCCEGRVGASPPPQHHWRAHPSQVRLPGRWTLQAGHARQIHHHLSRYQYCSSCMINQPTRAAVAVGSAARLPAGGLLLLSMSCQLPGSLPPLAVDFHLSQRAAGATTAGAAAAAAGVTRRPPAGGGRATRAPAPRLMSISDYVCTHPMFCFVNPGTLLLLAQRPRM